MFCKNTDYLALYIGYIKIWHSIFVGTETHFTIGKQAAYILNVSSGNRRIGIIHKLLIDDNEVPEYVE